jgi:hypothetical protein
MMRNVVRSLIGSCLLLLPLAAARADDDGRGPVGVPPGHLPPPGQCRVWIDGRPPGQQPPPTDCATARAQAARYGGRVVYGDDRDGDWRNRDPRWDDDDWDDDRWDDDRWNEDRYDDDRYDDDRYDRHGRDWDDRDRDRDWNDGRHARPRGCSDADWRRGRCRGELLCRDRDRDGWCDGTRLPARHPEMAWGVAYARGRWVPALRPWLHDASLGVRLGRAGRHGLPAEIVWFARGDRVVQRWLDDDRDGFADRVALYRDGRPWRVLRYR